ncbi:hypothetical protein SERLADRAFT_463746 [Serpula lacrymans var. lacrymans S7.9]|uniref:Uncharacterized protein n=1 Tax=Serpula lacrymans var. lacrymans (strain S7.9) TaxID=578457 RepID=F8NQ97_SERL9|nr:uncharacterized protein SERLADRAFT_463746 [Serpula lacrymans var. lacrymans S7.9]EGO26557.1 hypothetical protein SERLADRAFT_463746 [Serpula lacrymans var. lacrymans S7.9]
MIPSLLVVPRPSQLECNLWKIRGKTSYFSSGQLNSDHDHGALPTHCFMVLIVPPRLLTRSDDVHCHCGMIRACLRTGRDTEMGLGHRLAYYPPGSITVPAQMDRICRSYRTVHPLPHESSA